MTSPGEHLPTVIKPRRTLRDRLAAALLGRRPRTVLVLVNTTHGPRAVPVPARDLR